MISFSELEDLLVEAGVVPVLGKSWVSAMWAKKGGGAGYRSLCLMHAKHALYHLSYTPITQNAGNERGQSHNVRRGPLYSSRVV